MTVANQLAQCLSSIEGAAADLKTFALNTKDQQAKQLFQQLSKNLESSAQQLKGRLDYVMQEEPQYMNEIKGTYDKSNWNQLGQGTMQQSTMQSGTTMSQSSGQKNKQK